MTISAYRYDSFSVISYNEVRTSDNTVGLRIIERCLP